MIEKIKEHAWSWVGKAAALLGLVLLVFQVADRVQQPEYEVAALAVRHPMVVPDAFNQVVRNLITAVQEDTARVPISKADVALVDDFLRQEQVVMVTVSNQGQRELSKVVLETPAKGYYSSFPGKSIAEVRSDFETAGFGRPGETFSPFESEVVIGSLRPANQVTFVLWTPSSIFFHPEEYRVTHPNGAIQVEFTDHELDWFQNFDILFILILLAFIPTTVWAIRSEKRKTERIERIEAIVEKLAEPAVSESSPT